MPRARRNKAFTLLEILLVVAILALLAAFVVPSIRKSGEQAKKNLAEAAIGRNGPIAQALNRYQFDVGTYPETDEGLRALFERPSSIDEDDEQWKGPYLDGEPEELKDPWGREYNYRYPSEIYDEEKNRFDLWSNGPDGEEETDDDITNWIKK